jgi:Fe-S cluster biogenesis protein NfuA
MPRNDQLRGRLEQVEKLVATLERVEDPVARGAAKQLMQAVMDLHGAAIARLLEIVREAFEKRADPFPDLATDDLASAVLLLYGLHPWSLEERVGRALERIRPALAKHGAKVELLALGEASATLRLDTRENGCGSGEGHLRGLVEEALCAAAPEITGLVIEGAGSQTGFAGFVPVETLGRPAGIALAGASSVIDVIPKGGGA